MQLPVSSSWCKLCHSCPSLLHESLNIRCTSIEFSFPPRLLRRSLQVIDEGEGKGRPFSGWLRADLSRVWTSEHVKLWLSPSSKLGFPTTLCTKMLWWCCVMFLDAPTMHQFFPLSLLTRPLVMFALPFLIQLLTCIELGLRPRSIHEDVRDFSRGVVCDVYSPLRPNVHFPAAWSGFQGCSCCISRYLKLQKPRVARYGDGWYWPLRRMVLLGHVLHTRQPFTGGKVLGIASQLITCQMFGREAPNHTEPNTAHTFTQARTLTPIHTHTQGEQ